MTSIDNLTMTNPSLSYDVYVGDTLAAEEYSNQRDANNFAKGARFVLDNIRYGEDTKVEVVTNEHTYDSDDNYTIKEVSRKKFH